jgi:glycerophosphoryl diester phosphodiesterase
MGAFRNARDVGADGLELDVHLSQDGVLVVSHDATVDRTTNGSGEIRNLTFQEISALDAGSKWTHDGKVFPFRDSGYTIPRLSDVLDEFPDMVISLDMKDHSRRAVDAVVEMVQRFERIERTVVGSFRASAVRRYRRQVPGAVTAFSRPETLRLLFATRTLGPGRDQRSNAAANGERAAPRPGGPTHLMVPPIFKGLPVITRESVERAHRAGAVVGAWTINTAAQMRAMIELGVDAIITDRPDTARELIQEF